MIFVNSISYYSHLCLCLKSFCFVTNLLYSAFGITGELATNPIRALSGGQKVSSVACIAWYYEIKFEKTRPLDVVPFSHPHIRFFVLLMLTSLFSMMLSSLVTSCLLHCHMEETSLDRSWWTYQPFRFGDNWGFNPSCAKLWWWSIVCITRLFFLTRCC